MEFQFTDEQLALRSMVRAFAREHTTESAVRAGLDEPEAFDRETWRRLGTDLGVLGLMIPADLGGAEAGAVELAIVAEELGRGLSAAPILSAALVGAALAGHAQEPAAQELVSGLVEGRTVVALAATDDLGHWHPERPTVTARQTDGGWILDGTQSHVLDAAAADALLVLAGTNDGETLFLVDVADSGLVRQSQSTLDQTRRLARIELTGVAAVAVGEPGSGTAAVRAARDVGALVLAAEATGALQHLVEMSVEYAKNRLQFGRAIGSFQGVKHRCANMHAAAELTRSAAYHAAWAYDEGVDSVPLAVDLATVVSAGAYLDVVKDTVQVHGGIGFTWEHPTHLYYKRAVSDAALLGGRAAAADRLGDLALEDAS
jgi:alkylation response protein AidB-like acyl-CoA dehydrogenase